MYRAKENDGKYWNAEAYAITPASCSINDGAVIDKQNGTGVMFERFTHSLAGFFSRDYIQDAVAAEIIAWFPMLGFAAQDGISLISPALLHCPVRP
jgi:hypothetical protein